jgi:hypothetical protein
MNIIELIKKWNSQFVLSHPQEQHHKEPPQKVPNYDFYPLLSKLAQNKQLG